MSVRLAPEKVVPPVPFTVTAIDPVGMMTFAEVVLPEVTVMPEVVALAAP